VGTTSRSLSISSGRDHPRQAHDTGLAAQPIAWRRTTNARNGPWCVPQRMGIAIRPPDRHLGNHRSRDAPLRLTEDAEYFRDQRVGHHR
jgi:hypothetical protein